VKRNASQVARAPGAVRGKRFIRVRVKLAGADAPALSFCFAHDLFEKPLATHRVVA